MAVKGYCGGNCGEEKRCEKCRLDQMIPCSPNCENLTADGKIRIKRCLEEGCEEVKYIFGMPDRSDEEIIQLYGDIAPYPYE